MKMAKLTTNSSLLPPQHRNHSKLFTKHKTVKDCHSSMELLQEVK